MTATLPSLPSARPTTTDLADPSRPAWARPALLALLGVTSLLYLWGLSASGWGNAFYAAAAQAGSESWKAFFFGASDAAASITVDKTPLSVWVMALSVRIFGLSSWSVLVPQALMGVASVGLLCSIVRRASGSWAAGLVAGTVLALTPVAALMFRFDNPDALLVLLLIGAAGATLRGIELSDPEPSRRALRWLVLAGVLVGLGFLTKMLQAFLVLPAFALAYAVESRLGWGRRVGHLLAALAATVLAAGWWVAAVELWPGTRPYIGGSQNDSILELTLGYNGLGRLTGDEAGAVVGGPGIAPGGAVGGAWGQTGLLRLFDAENGGQASWLLPVAIVLLLTGLWVRRAAPRGDRVRAGLLVWGGWLIVTAVVFSFMAGIFHAYYAVALAPAIGAVVGLGGLAVWRAERGRPLLLATVAVLGATWAFVLLSRTPDFVPWLRWVVLATGLGAGLVLAVGAFLPRAATRIAAALTALALLGGPAAATLQTVATPHTGSIPSAGPASAVGFGRGGAPMGGPVSGPAGALLEGSNPGENLVALLLGDADDYTWVAATVGANSAAGYQLATQESVMPVGGFNGSDPSPTLAEFQSLVAKGEIHYFLGGGFGGFGGGGPAAGGGTSSEITAWVESTFTPTTVDGIAVYDLTAEAASS